jgi:uncharacterized membrane protein YesL
MTGLSFEKIMKITEMITEFVMLNVMWFAGCILGGVIFGWAPSTVALLAVIRNKIMKKEYYGVVRSFWATYKKEFVKSNILGTVSMLFLVIVSINKINFDLQPEGIFAILSVISTIARVFICGIILYMFPLYVHYNMGLKEYFTRALNLLVVKPFVTICIILWSFLAYVIIIRIPGLIAIFGVSVYFYGIMAINYQFFMRNEQRLRIGNPKESIN